ncbi:hypothetical protein [Marmoricola sp. RAF53]
MSARDLSKQSTSTRIQTEHALQRAVDEQMERLRERQPDDSVDKPPEA